MVAHPSLSADDSTTSVFDRDGAVMASWRAERVGYHGVAPMSLCVDSLGDVYIGVVTGERDAGRPTLCRMRSSDPRASVECRAVQDTLVGDFESEGLGRLAGGVAITSMTAPEPGVVVFAFSHYDRTQGGAVTRLMRIDW